MVSSEWLSPMVQVGLSSHWCQSAQPPTPPLQCKGQRKAPFHPKCHWDLMAEMSHLQTRGKGRTRTLFDSLFHPNQPSLPVHPIHERKDPDGATQIKLISQLVGWMFSGSLISRQQQTLTELCSFCSWSLFLCILKCQLWSSHPEVQLSFHPVTFLWHEHPIKASSLPQMARMVKMKTEMPALCFA